MKEIRDKKGKKQPEQLEILEEIKETPLQEKSSNPMDEEFSRQEQELYEQRKAARLERVRLRKKKEKQKKIILTALLLAVAAGSVTAAVLYFKHVKPEGIKPEKPQAVAELDADLMQGDSEKSEKKEKSEKVSEDKKDKETKPAEDTEKSSDKDTAAVLKKAEKLAAQYDYDKAIKLLKKTEGYENNNELKAAAKKYKEIKDTCVSWPIEEVTHVFYHSLIVDNARAFDGDYKEGDYNQVMTTIEEFNKITQEMYDRGYVMVSIYDLAKVNEDGTMTRGEILLPPGKIPFILSQDDVCYYHYMDGDGFATKLVVDEDGKVRNEYVEADGSVSVGDYDMVPLIDRFVEEHPDFSYRGAKGILALTGYNGILGYRTDISYETRPEDLDANKVEWLDAHPEFNLEEERANAKKVAEAMKKNGWLFASHTWGHQNVGEASLERLQADTQKFKENVDPLIGGTDIIIFAFGTDLTMQEDYSGDKFEFFKGQGYNYFCNVDSTKYFVQLRDRYFRMGRRNLDGYRMYYNPELVEDLFDANAVFDPARPVPVPPMG